MIGHYQTTRAFRAALEERLKQTAREQGLDLMRLRRQVAFDRMLARLFEAPNVPWLLKGGYSFELRLGGRARATKDLDLAIPDLARLAATAGDKELLLDTHDTHARIRERLQEAAAADLGDGFVFRVGMPMADLDTAPYGGARYPIEAVLDGRRFAAFHLDVGVGDAVILDPEWLTTPDVLGFAEIPPARVAVLAREQQFAEKIHAYTLPRGERTNTRVKDLVDLVLLLRFGLPDRATVERALQATFVRRATHAMLPTLTPPPQDWRAPFEQLAAEVDLPSLTMDAAFGELVAYWDTLTT